jgi:hypothetical protein
VSPAFALLGLAMVIFGLRRITYTDPTGMARGKHGGGSGTVNEDNVDHSQHPPNFEAGGSTVVVFSPPPLPPPPPRLSSPTAIRAWITIVTDRADLVGWQGVCIECDDLRLLAEQAAVEADEEQGCGFLGYHCIARAGAATARGAFDLARAAVNLPFTLTAAAAATAAGADCDFEVDLTIACFGTPDWLDGPAGGITIGNSFLTRTSKEDFERTAKENGTTGERLLAHERRHSTQWAFLGLRIIPLYLLNVAATGNNPCRNVLEIDAGLADGGYSGPNGPCP